MNILIVKTSAIGDVTHTLPALNCLRRAWPDARIDWLVEEAAADLVVGHHAVDHVLVSKRKQWVSGLRSRAWLQNLKAIFRFLGQLREIKYDLVIDFQGLLKSGILVGVSRGKRKVGFGRGMQHAECSYIFLNERLPAVDMEVHALQRELLLLEGIDVPCSEVVFDLPVSGQDRQQVLELLGENSQDRNNAVKPLVAINPQTKWETKLWENERFAQVADQLVAQGCRVIFTGGPPDRIVIEKIQESMKQSSLNLAGRSSLKILTALYERADLVISTDTGPMHIAAAAGTPVVALFGPTAPWRTGPYGKQHQVLRIGISCSPCFKRQCSLPEDRKKRCMKEISVELVVDAALKILLSNPIPANRHNR
jgi:lipopolysaccharide heptosyltransferase I